MSENCGLPLAIDAGAPSNTRVVRRGLQVRKPGNLAAPHEKGGPQAASFCRLTGWIFTAHACCDIAGLMFHQPALLVGNRRNGLTSPLGAGVPAAPPSESGPGPIIILLTVGISGVPRVANLCCGVLRHRPCCRWSRQKSRRSAKNDAKNSEFRHGFFLSCCGDEQSQAEKSRAEIRRLAFPSFPSLPVQIPGLTVQTPWTGRYSESG